MSQPPEQLPFDTLAGYKIISVIGKGGMGTVYKAKQLSMDRIIALKILPKHFSKNQVYINRFIREAQTAAKLNHPNIINAIDVGQDKGFHYFAMEYVPSITLKKYMEPLNSLEERYAIHIIKQVVAGLEHAKKEGIIHRDIKPENILLTSAASREFQVDVGSLSDVIKIADLGLAKYEDDHELDVTQEGATLGTPHYISPEQALGNKDIDFRSDIYSLGATFYHMVTGQPPFSGRTASQILTSHVSKPLKNPCDIHGQLSQSTASIIMRMMQKDKDKRYSNHQELLDDLNKAETGKKVDAPIITPRGTETLVDITHEPSVEKNQLSKWISLFIAGFFLLFIIKKIFFVSEPQNEIKQTTKNPKNTEPKFESPSVTSLMSSFRNDPATSPENSFTSRINFWQEAKEQIDRLNDPDRPRALSEIEATLKNLKISFNSAIQKSSEELKNQIIELSNNKQWKSGEQAINQWPNELQKLYPQENISPNQYEPIKNETASLFWQSYRNEIDQQCQRAWDKKDTSELKHWAKSQPDNLIFGSNTLSLKEMLETRINQIENAINVSQSLAIAKREANLINKWDPKERSQEQIKQLRGIFKASIKELSHLNQKEKTAWLNSLKQWNHYLSDAASFQNILYKNVNEKSRLKIPSENNRFFQITNFDPKTGDIHLSDHLKKITLNILNLPLDILSQFNSESFLAKLSSSHKKILSNDQNAFYWLLTTNQLDKAFFWLHEAKSPPKNTNHLEKMYLRVKHTYRFPLPHLYNQSTNAFTWMYYVNPKNLSKWFYDQPYLEQTPQKPLEFSHGGLLLHGKSITFWPYINAQAHWSFQGISKAIRDDHLQLILSFKDEQWVFTVHEGGLHLNQNGQIIQQKKTNLLRHDLPFFWKIENKSGEIKFSLHNIEIMTVPFNFKNHLQISLTSKKWPIHSFKAHGENISRFDNQVQ